MSVGTTETEAGACLEEKIRTRSAVIGVIGLGYVGLPLASGFARAGFRVLGFDLDETKVASLEADRSYIAHFPDAVLEELHRKGTFSATSDFSRLRECDALLLCVPTPLTPQREPDLSFVASTADQVAAAARPGQLVVLESTTYPGTTDEILRPALEARGFVLDRDFFLAFSPEREDPNNSRFPFETIPKVVGGVTPRSGDLASRLYALVVERVVTVADARVAEAVKLFENIFRAVNIALVNELKICFDRMGIDMWAVLDAAATKPFGFMRFDPGPGLGGHCIPVDPFYLTWKAREYGVSTRFIELAGEINSRMPGWVLEKLGDALNQRGRSLKGSRVLIVGVAYKKNVDDVRESPALEIIKLALSKGSEVLYHDPFVPKLHRMRRHDLRLESIDLTEQALARSHAVVLVTDHDALDYRLLATASLLLDCRGAFRRRGLSFPGLVDA